MIFYHLSLTLWPYFLPLVTSSTHCSPAGPLPTPGPHRGPASGPLYVLFLDCHVLPPYVHMLILSFFHVSTQKGFLTYIPIMLCSLSCFFWSQSPSHHWHITVICLFFLRLPLTIGCNLHEDRDSVVFITASPVYLALHKYFSNKWMSKRVVLSSEPGFF